MGRAERVSKAVKRYDPKLYCERREGKLCVLRKSSRVETYDVDGLLIDFVRPAPSFVFALTHNWKMNGEPVEWGLLPIIERLRMNDLWSRDLADECIRATEKATESKEREKASNNEAFLKDFRRQFAKATDGINTANLAKIDRRRKDEENGNCK